MVPGEGKFLSMPSTISKRMPSNTSVSSGVTESGLRYVSAPAKASRIFTVERFDQIMRKHGAVPLTAAERGKYAKFLKR
jgi:hypothetical protein